MVGRLGSSYLWGRFSDRYGRLPALYISLCSLMIFPIAFGMSTSFFWAIASRWEQSIDQDVLTIHLTLGGDFFVALRWKKFEPEFGINIYPLVGQNDTGILRGKDEEVVITPWMIYAILLYGTQIFYLNAHIYLIPNKIVELSLNFKSTALSNWMRFSIELLGTKYPRYSYLNWNQAVTTTKYYRRFQRPPVGL